MQKNDKNTEVNRESPIFPLRYDTSSWVRRNCCQRSSNNQEKDEQRLTKAIKKKMKNALRGQERMTSNHQAS